MTLPRRFKVASLAVVAIGAPTALGAAESLFVGHTLKAVFGFTSQACKSENDCEEAQSGQRLVHVYFGTKGNVFDYGAKVGTGDFLLRLNKPHLTKLQLEGVSMQIEQTWTLRGNLAMHRLVGQSGGAIQANLATFTMRGGKCVATLSWIRPGYRHRATFSRSECSLTRGQIEP